MPLFRLFSAAVIAVSLSSCMATSNGPSAYEDLGNADAQVNVVDAAVMISAYRAQSGIGPVRSSRKLSREAQIMAQTLALQGDSSLEGSDSLRGQTEEGRGYVVYNSSAGYRRWAEAFSGWRHSPQHNDVMLDPKISRIGLATAYNPSSKYKVFWVMVGEGDKP